MGFDVNNFIIDRVIRGVMTSTADGSVLWSLNQIKSPKLAMTSDTVEATDAIGISIATFERAKKATFSGENAVFDLSLLAAQMGTAKKVAAVGSLITAPVFDTLDIAVNKVVLSKTPVVAPTQVYVLNSDSTLGKEYTSGVSATGTNFLYESGTKTITLPTGVTGQVFVKYEYTTSTAVEVSNKATEFPKAGEFILEILGVDVCDPTTLIYAYLIFPSAKLSAATDLSFETEMSQAFELACQQDYCSTTKELWKLIIPGQ